MGKSDNRATLEMLERASEVCSQLFELQTKVGETKRDFALGCLMCGVALTMGPKTKRIIHSLCHAFIYVSSCETQGVDASVQTH